VRETGNDLFNLGLEPGQGIPLGWLFWILTLFIPLLYIAAGIRNKDSILIRSGLILVFAGVLTFRNYHHILATEIALVLGGILLTLIAYGLTRYLKYPKHGFSSEEFQDPNSLGRIQIESLVIAQTFGTHQVQLPDSGHTDFGGGSGGGGGAGGEF
jgi:hypothetical protein